MKVKPHRPYTGEYENGQPAPNLLVYLLWLLVHKLVTIVEQLMQSLRQPFFSRRIRIKAHQYAEHQQQQQQLPAPVSKLSKVPKHLVVLLGPEPPLYRQLAQFIFWSLAAEIEYVSFYDHNGTIKRNCEEVKRCVREAPVEGKDRIVWLERSGGGAEADDSPRQPVGSGRTVVVGFLAPEDGKQGLVSLSRSIGESVRRRDLYAADVSIELLDSRLQAALGAVPDPDLALYFGDVCSTYGLLPWQIRLTEFLPLGTRLRDSTEREFVRCLHRYAKCEQRLGT
ncbi:dehydrodolichyl diphosphate synthase complex subunit Nus1 [Anopheles arabiensis]|uniref:ditrans,polycis-polyprenyl diphosphate synthase [(2E,6E)-farnesyldiphosphate specific] n=1 Tax=Anopheles arabiensis TaxID=7173 RepID=A0A182IAU9_ANOAR|nr:dehydrodolichyl diphosphate synthase complex subunit Nus1 [Anopheles arabiensis]